MFAPAYFPIFVTCIQMDSTAPKKCGLGRGPTQIPRAPTNPDDRELIQLRQTPYNVYISTHTHL